MGGPSMHWTRFHYTGQKIEKGIRGGDAKISLFAPVYMTEYVPSILQTVNDNMTLAKTKSITENSHMMIGKVSLPDKK